MATATRSMLAQAARGRSRIYTTLANCFAPPAVPLVQELRQGGLRAFLAAAMPEVRPVVGPLLDAIPARLDQDDTTARLGLEVAYNRLFVGPGHVLAPPYESVYHDDVPEMQRRLVMGPCTTAVKQAYAKYGMRLRREVGELPDHVRVELEFMARLTEREAGLWEGAGSAGDQEAPELEGLLADEQAFVAEHLAWFLPFAERLQGSAEEPLYRALAVLLQSLIRHEQEVIPELVKAAKG